MSLLHRANPADLLKKVPLFEGMSARDLKVVAAEMREDSFKAGKAIVTEGDPGGRFYLIVEGQAKVTQNGRSRGVLQPGDSFGELSLIDKGPRSATVTAQTDVVARSLTSISFLALLDEHSSMSRKVMVELAKLVRKTEKALNR